VSDLLVLHDLGGSGGGEWADAFDRWPGRVIAPDLPGHDRVPPPVGGNYEPTDAVYVALELLRADPVDDLVVVGIGHSGATAQILALGGRASGLVLVDGLGGPWLDADRYDAHQRAMRRRILTTPEALAGPAPDAPDPRAALVVGDHDRAFAIRRAEAIRVPVLVVETSRSSTPDAAQITHRVPRAVLHRTDALDPDSIADAVRSWWSSVGRTS
jgi:pimeloyl-ACP methyl ester carboxylesterase